ncbi:hypothetical protein DIPPA_04268 [Diplonema papillatum]|nr:hypothetical protein DIPPA_04268 [Diplonema papillatum]
MGPRVVVVGPLPPAVRQALRQAGADDAAAAAGPAAVRDGSHVLVSGADADEAVVAALRGRVAAGQPTFLVGPAVALLPSVVAGFAAQPAEAPAHPAAAVGANRGGPAVQNAD